MAKTKLAHQLWLTSQFRKQGMKVLLLHFIGTSEILICVSKSNVTNNEMYEDRQALRILLNLQ